MVISVWVETFKTFQGFLTEVSPLCCLMPSVFFRSVGFVSIISIYALQTLDEVSSSFDRIRSD